MIVRTYASALWQTQNLPGGTAVKPKERKIGHPKTLLTKEQALECRARHEFYGWADWQCADHYGTTLNHMQRFLAGETRIRLIHEKHHANLTEQ